MPHLKHSIDIRSIIKSIQPRPRRRHRPRGHQLAAAKHEGIGGFLFTPIDPSKYRLNFRSENRLTGTSDCNTITGSYFQESTGFRFEPFVSTRKLCPPGSLHNNLALILKDVNAIEFRDGKMYMTNGYDGVELEFEERDF